MAGKKGGLIFGIITGTLLGIIFAPGKGRRFRDNLAKEIKEGGLGTKTLSDNIREMGRDMKKTAHETYENPEVQKTINLGGNNLKNGTLGLLGSLLKALKSHLKAKKQTHE